METNISLANETQITGGFERARKRFLIFVIAGLLVTATSMGVSFTADSGVTQVTTAATGGALPLVWSANYGVAGNLPATVTDVGTAGWKYGTVGTGSTSVPTAPVWPTVVAGQAGSVTTSGDIAIIDATDTSATYLLVTIYTTNMKALALTYNSYSLPFRIYSSSSLIHFSQCRFLDKENLDGRRATSASTAKNWQKELEIRVSRNRNSRFFIGKFLAS